MEILASSDIKIETISASEEPLSADVGIVCVPIRAAEFATPKTIKDSNKDSLSQILWLYDVGCSEAALARIHEMIESQAESPAESPAKSLAKHRASAYSKSLAEAYFDTFLDSFSEPLSEPLLDSFSEPLSNTFTATCADFPVTCHIVCSHFHPDHIGNLTQIMTWPAYKAGQIRIYVGRNTFRYTQAGEIVESDLYFDRMHIFPMPSSHAKGSLGLEVDETYVFLGDALYPTTKADKRVYNAGLLQEQIALLERLPATKCCLSHQPGDLFVQEKTAVLQHLKEIYKKRVKNEPYIAV